jgi:hypothetical protein
MTATPELAAGRLASIFATFAFRLSGVVSLLQAFPSVSAGWT